MKLPYTLTALLIAYETVVMNQFSFPAAWAHEKLLLFLKTWIDIEWKGLNIE